MTRESTVLAAYWGTSTANLTSPSAVAFFLTKTEVSGQPATFSISVKRGQFDTWGDMSSNFTVTNLVPGDASHPNQMTLDTSLQTNTWYTLYNRGGSSSEQNAYLYSGYLDLAVDPSATLSTSEAGGYLGTLAYAGGLNGGGGQKVFNSYFNTALPEPTTATLSLLALAGLAARRRRK